ncbi:hypothetical protein [Kamptonema formosum]|uniref:hypothetical protein n=1 Tax=Kamptonema formosum TaxID=331992 RepID=UPI00034A2A90|nr:hypothetical protein [Oscillatoria sp. PCC 10802]
MPRRLAQPANGPYLIRAITDSQSTIVANWQAICQAVWLWSFRAAGFSCVANGRAGHPALLAARHRHLGPRYSSLTFDGIVLK